MYGHPGAAETFQDQSVVVADEKQYKSSFRLLVKLERLTCVIQSGNL